MTNRLDAPDSGRLLALSEVPISFGSPNGQGATGLLPSVRLGWAVVPVPAVRNGRVDLTEGPCDDVSLQRRSF
jgi:hypothetical protein